MKSSYLSNYINNDLYGKSEKKVYTNYSQKSTFWLYLRLKEAKYEQILLDQSLQNISNEALKRKDSSNLQSDVRFVR